jgi:hypothetical protein
MEREKLESMLIEYIDGNMEEKDRLLIETELEKNQEAKILYVQLKEVMVKMSDAAMLVPGEALKSSFEQFLSQEVAKKAGGKNGYHGSDDLPNCSGHYPADGSRRYNILDPQGFAKPGRAGQN